MKQKLKILLILFITFFLVHEVVIISDGLIDDDSVAKVAVVLGSKVNEDGSLSSRLKARLDKGLQLYNDSQVKEIYVSGGLGKEGRYEGTVMAEYLVSKGIPKQLIKIDNLGINTRATAVNFVKDYPHKPSAIVVTQYFHITRTKLALKQVGITEVYGAHCVFFEPRDIYSTIREFFGYYKYLIFH